MGPYTCQQADPLDFPNPATSRTPISKPPARLQIFKLSNQPNTHQQAASQLPTSPEW